MEKAIVNNRGNIDFNIARLLININNIDAFSISVFFGYAINNVLSRMEEKLTEEITKLAPKLNLETNDRTKNTEDQDALNIKLALNLVGVAGLMMSLAENYLKVVASNSDESATLTCTIYSLEDQLKQFGKYMHEDSIKIEELMNFQTKGKPN